MSKKYVESHHLEELRKQVIAKAGFDVNNKAECLALAGKINESNVGTLSESTLYRIFISSGGHVPYKETLNILAKYLNHLSWDSFVQELHRIPDSKFKKKEDNIKSLLFICIQHEDFAVLKDYFNSITSISKSEKFAIAFDLFDGVCNLAEPLSFYIAFATNSFVREYFFELLFDPHFRIKDYEKGFQLYRGAIGDLDNLKNIQDEVFACTVMIRHNFITSKPNRVMHLGNELYNNSQILRSTVNDIPTFTACRYHCCYLYYLKVSGATQEDIDKYVHWLTGPYLTLFYSSSVFEQRIVVYNIVETLTACNLIELHQQPILQFLSEKDDLAWVYDGSIINIYAANFEPNTIMIYRPYGELSIN